MSDTTHEFKQKGRQTSKYHLFTYEADTAEYC